MFELRGVYYYLSGGTWYVKKGRGSVTLLAHCAANKIDGFALAAELNAIMKRCESPLGRIKRASAAVTEARMQLHEELNEWMKLAGRLRHAPVKLPTKKQIDEADYPEPLPIDQLRERLDAAKRMPWT